MKYALIKQSDLDFDTLKVAHMALASARKELRLPMVKIKWFNIAKYVSNPIGEFEYDKEIRGQFKSAEPDTIYIEAWQSEKATQDTVYHETFHLWQFKQGLGFGEHSEKLAQDYADDIMKRMRLYGQDEETYLEHMVGKDWSEKPKAQKPKETPPLREYNPKAGIAGQGPSRVESTKEGLLRKIWE